MKIHRDFDNLKDIKNAVVTTGSFDGVHIGHKTIIKRINEIAKEIGGESVLITFFPHPRKVLYPDTLGKELLFISSQEEKIRQLEETGLDHLIIATFTKEFSQTSSSEFVKNILLEKIQAKKIVIGFNHHFGHNKEGDYEKLATLGKECGFDVEEIAEQDIKNEAVSSTRIRKAISDGFIQKANAYLDHIYFIIGKIEDGNNKYIELGVKTYRLPIEEDSKQLPPDGLYAVYLWIGKDYYKGIVNIAHALNKEKEDSRDIQLDLHLFEDGEKIIGEKGIIRFYKQVYKGSIFEGNNAAGILNKGIREVEELIF